MGSTQSEEPNGPQSGAEKASKRPQASVARKGFLFPTVPAVVEQRRDGAVELIDLSRSWRYVVEGELGADVMACIANGAWSARLDALGERHELVRTLVRLQPQRRRRLSACTTLPLSGFDTLFVMLTERCASHCVHCAISDQQSAAAVLPWQILEPLISDAEQLGLRRVLFFGGEPLAHQDLVRAVRHARELGIPDVEIHTTGLLLNEGLLEELAPLGPTFAFSFYSHERPTHERITRTVGSHHRTVEAVERAAQRGLAVRVSIAVLDSNARHVIPTVDLLQTMGVRQISLATVPTCSLKEKPMPAPVDDSANDDEAPVCSLRRICRSLYADPNGNIYDCIPSRNTQARRVGRVPEQRLVELADDIARASTSRVQEPACQRAVACATFISAGCQALAYVVGST